MSRFPTFARAFRAVKQLFAGRDLTRGYAELAKWGQELGKWIFNGITIDAEIFQNLPQLRQMSRDQFVENCYLRKFRDELKANVFGAQGITLQMKIKEESDRVVYAPDDTTDSGKGKRELAYLLARQRENREWSKRGKAFGIHMPTREFVRFDGEQTDGIMYRGSPTNGDRAKATVKAGQPDVFANNLIEAAWKEWQRAEFCDIAGKRNYRTIRHMRLYQAIRDGEVFIRLIRGKNVNKFGFSIQLINADWINHNLNRPAQFDINGRRTANEIRMGIERDQFGKTVAYYIIKRRPNDWQYSVTALGGYGSFPATTNIEDHERIDARDMIHYAMLDEDVDQTRGAPAIASVLRKLRYLDKYEESEVVSARSEACKGGHYEAELPGLEPEELATKIEAGSRKLTQEVEPGMWKALPFGWSAKPHDPTHPNGNFETFRKGMLRSICSGLPGGAYSRIGSDYESVNFSSSRAEGLNINEMWMLVQEFDIDSAERPVFEAWLEMALTTGAIPLPLSKLGKFNKATFQGRRWDAIDPLKQAQGDALQVANYQSSRTIQCNQRGLDFEEIVEQQSIERIILLEAGLDPTPAIGKTTQQSNNTGDAMGDPSGAGTNDSTTGNGNGNGAKHLSRL